MAHFFQDFINLRPAVKPLSLIHIYGECLGANRRRRTRQAAKILGKLQASDDPGVSEWGNLIDAILDRSYLNTWGMKRETR